MIKKNDWENVYDSMFHAVEHIKNLNDSDRYLHEVKWIILNVHHAVECYFKEFLQIRKNRARP